MSFEEELSKGNFIISKCQKCELTIWPPNEICNKCFGHTQWEKCSQFGTLIEFSQENNKIFCLAEFDGRVRIMGTLETPTEPKIGQKVRLVKSTISDGNYHFEMSLC